MVKIRGHGRKSVPKFLCFRQSCPVSCLLFSCSVMGAPSRKGLVIVWVWRGFFSRTKLQPSFPGGCCFGKLNWGLHWKFCSRVPSRGTSVNLLVPSTWIFVGPARLCFSLCIGCLLYHTIYYSTVGNLASLSSTRTWLLLTIGWVNKISPWISNCFKPQKRSARNTGLWIRNVWKFPATDWDSKLLPPQRWG